MATLPRFIESGAYFGRECPDSGSGVGAPYRYTLWRRWTGAPMVAFVMLNPSVANAYQLDPTVRRCCGFAHDWGYGGLLVLNAFALRSTDPRALKGHPDPVGPDNDYYLGRACDLCEGRPDFVVAWGNHGHLNDRAGDVLQLLHDHGVRPWCLGHTKTGAPKHPLYVAADAPRFLYDPERPMRTRER